ncbi:F-box protein: endocytic membrane traffic, recycling ReCYcling 1 [Exophiala xenobiotica]|nr:F-box protein: endocytic membrane traffic, recycling ReCYcling 1 [Exophiala xenobiotica]KAK5209914.1 F-box protein: endocytic membrane traffic, recycling ReCYcling 1 [Exophiala xenobiotica]KAK5225789.1 F-box protein: endocytic membrane traffic, recycling ReCYcling 1 [Exophiala xenobiotica]KAK5298609.1 F-box protein: endocytic membrane traffic, recycling ReCYcling 1 [Exophiala xenobiotica]KAK5330183.1 F-box protein: endocytic membrane traffic, recycling ReCYcling 1 [Exophiala xenobiotica]
MPTAKRPTAPGKAARRDPLASLRLADMVISKPVLPAEVVAVLLDYLDVPDLLRFARTSRRMHEMVYDEARWVRRLRAMGCWNDAGARKRTEAIKNPTTPGRRRSTIDRNVVNSKGRPEVLFDAESSPIAQRRQTNLLSPLRPRPAADGFDVAELASPKAMVSPGLPVDPDAILSIYQRVKSIRGLARQEYGKIYKLLAPYYRDLSYTSNPMECRIFKDFSVPEQQAQLLANVRIFSASDFSPESGKRRRRVQEAADILDTAALLEFRKGYEYKDIQGRMRQYARVMHILNGGRTAVDLFLHDNQLINQRGALGSVSDCIDYSSGHGQLSLEKVHAYFERLGTAYSEENAIVEAVFPNAKEVSLRLVEEVAKDILAPFLSSLFEDAQARSTSLYLRILSGTFAATSQFIQDFALPNDADETTISRCNAIVANIYGPHLENYLSEELAFFRHKADAEVEQWDRALSEQDASAESFLMSTVNRQADKKDFMSSFKKVVMMPVNILPSFSAPSNTKTTAKALVNGESAAVSRPSTPNLSMPRTVTPSLSVEAPSSELAAKAALMNSKLENIRSLFSIEVALNLVHAAKSSLERAAQFISLAGEAGDSARKQCSAIFVLLLHSVGTRHVKAGFDKAIDHLSTYNPRETNTNRDNDIGQVAPLGTFLELVNVGDLIQQMLDVFYESELVRLGISKRDDFLDTNVKEKRKFEAMLDERVAAGLGKGIDALINEVEYICATTQLPTDFYPELANADGLGGNKASAVVTDFSGQPTATASRVIALVSHHTSMLTGATDKSLLDVFTAEVGLRLFTALTKHIQRQRISTLGALPLLSDLTAYANFVAQFRNNDLSSYYTALREVAQIYLIGGESERDVSEMATIISDGERYKGVFTVEEVVEFAERRSDWLQVKGRVEGKVKGDSCIVM